MAITAEKALRDYIMQDKAYNSERGNFIPLRHSLWNMEAALRLPPENALKEAKCRKQWKEECRAWIEIGLHPHIQQCYLVQKIDGCPFVFCEWQNGTEDLQSYVSKGSFNKANGEKDLLSILTAAVYVAAALDHIHSSGYLYLGLQPSCVLIMPDSDVKLTNFSMTVQKFEGYDGGRAKVPQFCAPEQAEGLFVDQRADIYSWAVLVLYMLAGKILWKDGPSAWKYLHGLSADLPSDLISLLEECLSADPEHRVDDMIFVIDALEKIIRRLNPDFTRLKSAQDTLDVMNNRALSFLALDCMESAAECWKNVLEKDPYHLCSWHNFYHLYVSYYDGYSEEVEYYEERTGQYYKKEKHLQFEKHFQHAPEWDMYVPYDAQLHRLYQRGDKQSLHQAGHIELLAAAKQISMGNGDQANKYLAKAKVHVPDEPGIKILEQELNGSGELSPREPEDALWAISPFRRTAQISEDRRAYQNAAEKISKASERSTDAAENLRILREKSQDLWKYLELNSSLIDVLPIKGIGRLIYKNTKYKYFDDKCKMKRLRFNKKTGMLSGNTNTPNNCVNVFFSTQIGWKDKSDTEYYIAMSFADSPLRLINVAGIPTGRGGRPVWEKAGFTKDGAYFVGMGRDSGGVKFYDIYVPEWLYE